MPDAVAALRGVRVDGRDRPRLVGVDLRFAAGEIAVVVGKNGSGKSTLLSAMLGFVRPDAGEVSLGGAAPTALTPAARAARVGWVPQSPRIERGLSAVELVASARYRFGEGRAAAVAAARAALVSAGASEWGDVEMSALSGGEAQRVRVAALIAQEAPLWLLDEPGNHLDVAATLELVALLVAEAGKGRAVVVVTHDLGLVSALPAESRVVGLRAGRVVLDGRLADGDVADGLGAALDLRVRAVDVDGRRFVAVGAAS